MEEQVSDFIHRYAVAFSQYNVGQIMEMFSVPSLIMTSGANVSIHDQQTLQENTEFLLRQYKDIGMASVSPTITHQLTLANKLRFVSVNWVFESVEQSIIFKCKTSYTLQQVDKQLKIAAVILDDELEAYHKASQQLSLAC
ncbi:hypothetical protein [Flocculibacter collagenilyticus]|uniref:hypothetical protein n=1 Tax=Flocculibacter collagenilyticus TaxID=2744479 RepID=UPI0018F40715|nr:hypothetical protein [Flocculibacter collagenilyticus]